MELKERIIHLRESKNYSKKYVADCSGIPYTTYIKYEYGERDLGIDALQKLADFYAVTTDYILGRSEDATLPNSHLTARELVNTANSDQLITEDCSNMNVENAKKKKLVEEMTNEQFRAMIVQIIKDNRKEEAIQKIEAILASSFRSL